MERIEDIMNGIGFTKYRNSSYKKDNQKIYYSNKERLWVHTSNRKTISKFQYFDINLIKESIMKNDFERYLAKHGFVKLSDNEYKYYKNSTYLNIKDNYELVDQNYNTNIFETISDLEKHLEDNYAM